MPTKSNPTPTPPLDLNACYQRDMKPVLKRAGIFWQGWRSFRDQLRFFGIRNPREPDILMPTY
jgi:hypothetical protein